MTVTITAYKRPELLRRCLESVAKADISPVTDIIVSLDYASNRTTDEMVAVVREYRSFFASHDIYWEVDRPCDRKGVANNTRHAYDLAFSDRPIEFCCAIEEDTTVAPDAFVFAGEMLACHKEYRFVNLCSHQTPLGTDPTKVHEDNELRGGYGWAFTRDFWEYMEPRWNGKNRAPYGWDWYVTYLCYREKWEVLTPEVSRVMHTGREGTYCTPAWFDEHPQRVCDVIPERYEIVKHDLDWRQPQWVQDEMR